MAQRPNPPTTTTTSTTPHPTNDTGSSDVETRRELGDWRRVLDILSPTKGKGTSNAEPLMNFLFGESQLEIFLEDHQPAEKYISEARSALLDVKKTLLLCLNQAGEGSGLRTDAHILLAKVNYASGLYEETLEELDRSRFERIEGVAQTVRNLQLMAEANAIEGGVRGEGGALLAGMQLPGGGGAAEGGHQVLLQGLRPRHLPLPGL